MQFKPGRSGNPNGRPRGSKNRATKELKERIADFLEDQFDTVVKGFRKMEPKDQATLWLKLAEYTLPKLQRRELIDETPPKWAEKDFSVLTTDELDVYHELSLKMERAQREAEERAKN